MKLLYYQFYYFIVKPSPYLERGAEVKMLENKVLRKIFWCKRDEITGE